jgi:hypothetical protein
MEKDTQAIHQTEAQPVVQYASKPKAKSIFLGFEFTLALAGVVLGSLVIIQLLFYVFALWNDGTMPVLSFTEGAATPIYGVLAEAFFGLILAAFPFVFFPRFKRALVDRPMFTKRLAYKLPLYVSCAIAFFATLYVAAHVAALLISSLLLIGVDQVNIGQLYVQEFLPLIIVLGFMGFVSYLLFNILIGKDKSKLLSLILVSLMIVLMLTVLITSTIKTHTDSSSRTTNNAQDNTRNQMQNYYNSYQ